ncbi:helix-turn-helix domain-containing protein [Pseudorhodoplanes sp.]|uniref:helix-turn-helix transcriptional regulator n=1 Tax=Pseudorhodoplanes sp. TaxID=1934341 RepID=UPI002D092500|nr:helix-turn-helix domain-containing protein [Pseudorhodoplanes sp.]HWV51709.1 helix-turn-helix domain-containing protein [Pseudorhodoplanes sp.]
MAEKDRFERFLRTPEVARLLGLSPRTLEKHRTYGTGPRYRKLGGRVVYAMEDVRAWADIGLRESTNDPNARTIPAAKPIILPLTPRRRGGR